MLSILSMLFNTYKLTKLYFQDKREITNPAPQESSVSDQSERAYVGHHSDWRTVTVLAEHD